MNILKNYLFEFLASLAISVISIILVVSFPNYSVLILSISFLVLILAHFFRFNKVMIYIENLNNRIKISKNLSYKERSYESPLYILDKRMNSLILDLEKEVLETEELSRIKSEFLSNVSHEFKTPIFTITGLVDTLIEGAINDKEVNKKFLVKIKRQTKRLENLFSDLIMITKLESDSIKLKKDIFKLDEIFEWRIESYDDKAKSKGLNLSIPLNTNLPVYGDKENLKSVFSNLVDNAINYSNEGNIIVAAKNHPSNSILIKIIDNGIGIPLENQSKIFERFYRVDKDRSRETGGSGLGLSIVKHILLSHNTQAEVSSKVGIGTEFSFKLSKVKT